MLRFVPALVLSKPQFAPKLTPVPTSTAKQFALQQWINKGLGTHMHVMAGWSGAGLQHPFLTNNRAQIPTRAPSLGQHPLTVV